MMFVELLAQGLMMLMMGVLGILPVVVTVVCYFLSRAEEKRSGQVLFSGKAAIIFTLLNNATWLFAASWTMILFNLIGDMESFGGEKTWTVLRMGFALLVSSGISIIALLLLWKNWTGHPQLLPRENIFVKCFSGINMLVLSGLALYAGTFIIFIVLEAMSDNIKETGDTLKFPIVLLVTTLVFLVLNVLLFGSCSDAISTTPLHKEETYPASAASTTPAAPGEFPAPPSDLH